LKKTLQRTGSSKMPELVVAIDWSVNDRNRWMARAILHPDGYYLVFPPEPVGEIDNLLSRLSNQVPSSGVALVGFDIPIGLPESYAKLAGIKHFRSAMLQFGHGEWSSFYRISQRPILRRPFYPPPTRVPGAFTRSKLLQGLGIEGSLDLLRHCDRKTSRRGAAECLLFTLGGKQVGAGTIEGWIFGQRTEDIAFNC